MKMFVKQLIIIVIKVFLCFSIAAQGKTAQKDDFWNSPADIPKEKNTTRNKDDFWNDMSVPSTQLADLVFVGEGFRDKNGKIVIAGNYEEARKFEGGMCAVRSKGKWGFIDARGNLIIPCMYDRVDKGFDDDVAKVGTLKEKRELVHKGENKTFRVYYALFNSFFINKKNEKLSTAQIYYSENWPFEHGIVLVSYHEHELTAEQRAQQKRVENRNSLDTEEFNKKRQQLRAEFERNGYLEYKPSK